MSPRPVVSRRPGCVPPPLPAELQRRRRASRVGASAADSTIPLNLDDLMLEVAAEAAEEATGQPAMTSEPARATTSDPEQASRDEAGDDADLDAPAADDRGEHRAAN